MLAKKKYYIHIKKAYNYYNWMNNSSVHTLLSSQFLNILFWGAEGGGPYPLMVLDQGVHIHCYNIYTKLAFKEGKIWANSVRPNI